MDNGLRDIIDHLYEGRYCRNELLRLLAEAGADEREYLYRRARQRSEQSFGRGVYVRGLLEITSRCRCGCYYCGLRAENRCADRYELSVEEIMEACREGYAAGFRTFVLQGGEVVDRAERVADIVRLLKAEFEGVAVTLSLGEQSREVYELWRRAGADRYLLRHESATADHYALLHPARQTMWQRQQCISTLKELGYQTGAGMMIGSPYQSLEHLANDVEYMLALQPEMVGMGPFMPQSETPFGGFERGGVELTLMMLAVVRLLMPNVLLPSTTALASARERGLLMGIEAGANVVMPNLTPQRFRASYAIYDGKKSSGSESVEGLRQLAKELSTIGYHIDFGRGDHKSRV